MLVSHILTKSRLLFIVALLVSAAFLMAPPTSQPKVYASSTPAPTDIVRVEEDWVMEVNQPNSYVASPQVSTQMARAWDAQRFCNLHLNSRDVPSFQLGGLQLQVWRVPTNANVAYLNSANTAVMNTTDELVMWTQYLRQGSSQLYFGIGTVEAGMPGSVSTTWGDFSGVEIGLQGSNQDLNEFTAVYSQQNSGVTYGANRVQSLVLTAVRMYQYDGQVLTDYTPRVIYSQALDPQLSNP